MDKPAQNIQDSFLNTARKEKTLITLYLLSGVKLTGRIRSFDKYCLVLEAGSQEQMIFKHAISTVAVQRPGMRDFGERSASHVPVPVRVAAPGPRPIGAEVAASTAAPAAPAAPPPGAPAGGDTQER